MTNKYGYTGFNAFYSLSQKSLTEVQTKLPEHTFQMFIWCFCVFYYLQIKSSIHCELSDSVSTSLVLKGPWLTKFDVKAQRGTKVLFKASLSQTRISEDTWTLLFVCFLLVLLVHHIHSYKSSCRAHLFTTRILQKSSRNYSNFIQTSKRSIGA